MSYIKTALRGIAAAALLAGTGSVAIAQEYTFKMHQFLPAQASVPRLILDVWADRVEADSDGRIKIDRYPAMQLGGRPPELVDQVIDGVADIVWTLPGYTPGRFPRAEVFEMPFIMSNGEDTSRAYWRYAEKNMMDKDFAELKILGTWVHGPGLIHSKEPITSVSDLNGVKLRAPTRVINKLFTDMGATTIGMPVPAVPEALSKGVIDATVIPWEVTTALKVSELVENHTTWPGNALYTATFIWAMNKDKYEALPDDLKKVIDDNSGEEFSAFAGRVMQEADQPALEFAQERGNNIIDLSDEQIAEWKEAAAPIETWWVEEMTDAGLDGQALLDEAKALIEEASQ
ncbi:TRAP dicarboxylate transporter, DctP subunit [Pseudooceanicola batsensis HTCC2597]|uniref:TRAP dicarboxylate transporter, DctP subunit n=1 Tax=Pseudooceanicola batsensis (strain ATCC BAA-863 / DSM 15984 / KCTC 12145 / HTCC2597) TaxID=252305 RepID=A3TVG6_PSEBH|nr:TRAP transporter substrate-binding protein [Pseudooceanicola batsensis]EAQ04512.1 TRAP dicarboxylate transporter, DctP subunit [Pseudooceanicola batsensis HTCC2597]